MHCDEDDDMNGRWKWKYGSLTWHLVDDLCFITVWWWFDSKILWKDCVSESESMTWPLVDDLYLITASCSPRKPQCAPIRQDCNTAKHCFLPKDYFAPNLYTPKHFYHRITVRNIIYCFPRKLKCAPIGQDCNTAKHCFLSKHCFPPKHTPKNISPSYHCSKQHLLFSKKTTMRPHWTRLLHREDCFLPKNYFLSKHCFPIATLYNEA